MDKNTNKDYASERFNKKRGFTLIEILISAGVITIISTIAITYSRTSERQVSLYIESQKIASLIFRAKYLAVATYDSSGLSCGYGLEINYSSNSYSLFSYEPQPAGSCSSISQVLPENRKEISSPNVLPRGISFENVADSMYFVLFVPPDPKVLLGNSPGASVSSEPLKIHLETLDGNAKREIVIGPAGQIDF